MLQSFHYTKRTREIRTFPKDGRAVTGDYSSVLLHCLLENPVLPTILDAFKITMEWEADRMENYLFHVQLLSRMKLYLLCYKKA